MIAVLYARKGGPYSSRTGLDVWAPPRDARLYAGPFPVVAHPPCARWSKLRRLHGGQDGDDGGCFVAALAAVLRWGGVMEHPESSLAWLRSGIPSPPRDGWGQWLGQPGAWITEIDQGRYGHAAPKRTWLLLVGTISPPSLDWGTATPARRADSGRCGIEIMSQRQREITPEPMIDLLVGLASQCEPNQ